jgi:phage N-6-adenine-methyltransferase
VDWWRTPPELFAALCERYGFTVDAAAAPENALLPRYWSIDDDGLAQDWNGERVWCNPPYSAIEPFVAKAAGMESGLAVLLVPANRTEQDWWQRWVEPHRDNGGPLSVRFLRSRVRFLSPETGKPGDAPPFGCALLIWNRLPS